MVRLSFVLVLITGIILVPVGCDSKPKPAEVPSKENWKPIPKINSGRKGSPVNKGDDKSDPKDGKNN